MHLVVVPPHRPGTLRQLRAVAGVAGGAPRGVLGEHPPLQRGQVAHEVAEAEAAGGVPPLHAVVGDALDHAAGALADASVVGEKGCDVGDLHPVPRGAGYLASAARSGTGARYGAGQRRIQRRNVRSDRNAPRLPGRRVRGGPQLQGDFPSAAAQR